jgi:hypothetical protein
MMRDDDDEEKRSGNELKRGSVFDSNEDHSISLRSRGNFPVHKTSPERNSDDEEDGGQPANPNEHSRDFILRTMIPSSQRATREYGGSAAQMLLIDDQAVMQAPPAAAASYYLNFADERSVQYNNTKLLVQNQMQRVAGKRTGNDSRYLQGYEESEGGEMEVLVVSQHEFPGLHRKAPATQEIEDILGGGPATTTQKNYGGTFSGDGGSNIQSYIDPNGDDGGASPYDRIQQDHSKHQISNVTTT